MAYPPKPRSSTSRSSSIPPPPTGRVLHLHDLERLAPSAGKPPAFRPIPSKRVQLAEKVLAEVQKQFAPSPPPEDSPTYLSALNSLQKAQDSAREALRWYLQGKRWPDPLDWPSPQERVQYRTEFEIGLGGSRGGSKSFTEILFFTKGNPHLKPRSLVDTSYVYHPYYFAVVIRKDQIDLDNWVREAHRVYSLLGARWVGRPEAKFVFPHPKNPKLEGATIRTGHLQDASSYQKYIGKNIHRLGIEELIQIPDENAFLELRLSVRSQFPEIIPQILTTFNPIGGPGVAWVFHRYIEPKHRRKDGTLEPLLDSTGAPIKAYEPDWTPKYPEPIVEEEIGEEVFHRLGIPVPPLAERKRSRVFIPARVTDNPHLGADYILTLASDPDENRARAYLHGEWSLVGGSYLSHARFDGPLKNEPSNACHSVFRSAIDPDTHQVSELRRSHPAPEILPWWYRHMGGDWGFEHEAAFYWGATHPRTQQLVIYRERVFSHTYPEHVGVEIAQESLPELTAPGSSHSIILWIGRDVSQNRMGADRTVIEMLTRGMKRVLGNDGVHVPELLIREMEDEAYAQSRPLDPEALETFKNLKRSGITVRWARPQNKSGWEICRALFRWTPAVPVEGFDKDLAFKILSEDGMARYQEYVAHCSKREVEALPVLQVVYEACPRLIDALPKLQKGDASKNEDPDSPNYKRHFLGMDECLVAGTLVHTIDGEVPIEQVRAGTLVLTRQGYKPVGLSRCTSRNARVMEVVFSDGTELVGTPNHPIFVVDKGFTPLADLCYLDEVLKWLPATKRSSSTEPCLSATPSLHRGAVECTSTQEPEKPRPPKFKRFIKRFGSFTTALFKRVATFIMWMVTRSITSFPTLHVCHHQNICNCIMGPTFGHQSGENRTDGTWTERGRRLPYGEKHQQPYFGIKSRASEFPNTGRTRPSSSIHAAFAESSSPPSTERVSSFVQGTAQCLPEDSNKKMESFESASYVEIDSGAATDSTQQRTVPVSVVQLRWRLQSVPVYNLTVSEVPEYFANGILVHNCAAFYYLVQGWREDRHQTEPLQHYVERRMLELTQSIESQPSTAPTYSVMDLIRIRNGFEAEHRAKLAPTIIHPRHLSAQRGIAARREVAKLLGGGGERG